jgi:hypothetical protein
LKSPHWLPIIQRITFKIAVITYKVKKTSMPAYLHNLLIDHCTIFVDVSSPTLSTCCLFYVIEELNTGVELSVLLHPKYGTNSHPMSNYLIPQSTFSKMLENTFTGNCI